MVAGNRTLLGMLLVAMAVPLLITLVSAAARGHAALALVPAPAASGARCVQDPITMRYDHMTYLRRLRDRVVRGGDRSELGEHKQFGISGCGNCHVDRATFCNRCHDATGVRLDCFSCHEYGIAAPRPPPP